MNSYPQPAAKPLWATSAWQRPKSVAPSALWAGARNPGLAFLKRASQRRGSSTKPFLARLALTGLSDSNDRAHIADHSPRRQVMGQHAPSRTCPSQPAQGVKDFAQTVAPLGCALVDQSKVGSHETPLIVTHIAGVGLSGHHPNIGITLRKSVP